MFISLISLIISSVQIYNAEEEVLKETLKIFLFQIFKKEIRVKFQHFHVST